MGVTTSLLRRRDGLERGLLEMIEIRRHTPSIGSARAVTVILALLFTGSQGNRESSRSCDTSNILGWALQSRIILLTQFRTLSQISCVRAGLVQRLRETTTATTTTTTTAAPFESHPIHFDHVLANPLSAIQPPRPRDSASGTELKANETVPHAFRRGSVTVAVVQTFAVARCGYEQTSAGRDVPELSRWTSPSRCILRAGIPELHARLTRYA